MNRLWLYLTVLIVLPIGKLGAQSVDFGTLKDDIKKKINAKPYEISGGASLNAIYTEGSQPVSQPFTYVASGNIVLTVKGYKLPFSFTYSNKKFTQTNPNFRFNRTAFNPRYKNWAGHFGDVSMSFSPYTLSGVPFKGAGIEYSPNKFRFEVVAGQIYSAVAEQDSNRAKPTYHRIGAGVKTSYQGTKVKGSVSMFYGRDDKYSIPRPKKYDNAEVIPQENFAFAFAGSLPIKKIKGLSLDAEISTSVLTTDLNKSNERDTSKNPIAWLLKKRNSSTKVYHAAKTSLNYTIGETGSLALAYERVDPNYRTLGGLFFTHDFENVTLNAQYQGKIIKVGFNTGVQRDDIADKKRSSTGRMVIAGNVSFKASEKLNVSMNYSNFQSYTFIQTGFERINRLTALENLDTLSYTLLSQNASANANYKISQSEKMTQGLTGSINFMESAKSQNTLVQQNNATRFINGAFNYNVNWVPNSLTVAVGMNYALNYAPTGRTLTWGPTVSVSKPIYKTVMTNASWAYNRSRTGAQQSRVTTMSVGASTTVKKKHNLTFNLVGQIQRTLIAKPNMNITATAGYSYSF
jgi:hypothetical protein